MRERTDLRFNFKMSYLKAHRTAAEGVPPKPPRFKPRVGQEHHLPIELEHDLGPLHLALSGGLVRPLENGLGLRAAATAAHYTLGLMRYEPTDPYPLHRAAPSPRCLYASELYYVTWDSAVLRRGIYRYSPVRHTLEEMPLPGEGLLERCLTGAPQAAHWLLTSVMDRIGYLYGNFSIRLSVLEAGHVISQLRTVCRALGLATTVHPRVGDPELSQWLGEGETPLALIAPSPPTGSHGLQAAPPPPRPWLGADLRRTLLRRNSAHGPNGVYPAAITLSGEEISGLAWYALEEALEDPHSEEILRMGLYLVVFHSSDLTPGVYRWRPRERQLEHLFPVSPDEALARTLFTSEGFRARQCPVIAVMTADIQGAWRQWREEGYFRALEQAGRVAQRLGLAAAALGLFARPAVSLDEAATDRLLRLHLVRETAIYTTLIGKDRERGWPVRMAL
ncbi:MAG TPA: nitroreductase family protein [Hyalangium sp.]|nr:nitroreductase family protein [Hyalangium sp.]